MGFGFVHETMSGLSTGHLQTSTSSAGWRTQREVNQLNTIQPGPGVIIYRGSGGTCLSIRRPQVGPSPVVHNYTVSDATQDNGGTPGIYVSLGNHIDATGSATWIPSIDGTPINTDPAPILTVDPADTIVWFHLTVNDITGTSDPGFITALDIESGSTLPSNTNTDIYQICAFITVTETDGNYSIASDEGGVAGSQVYQLCYLSALFGLQ